MELVKFEKAVFEKNKLTISDSINIDEWKQLGQSLKQVEGSVQFWIGDWARYGDKRGFTGKYTDPKVYNELEEITGLDRGTIQNYKSVAERTSSLRNEDLSYNHHVEVAKLTPEKQESFLKRASDEKLSVRDLRSEITKDSYKHLEQPKLPDGKYSVIYADPPWPVGSILMDKWVSPIEDKYPTMTINEIKALPIEKLAADNCSLFLWTTHSFLPDTLDIIKEWGFKYHCIITWNKGSGWTQFGFHKMTEFIIFAYKGRMNINQYGKAIPTLINENKTHHSKKPDTIRDLIKSKTPEGRIELFAREKYEGWESWGNQL